MVAAGIMFLMGGCSNANQVAGYNAQTEGPPRVENCAIIAISTPSIYRCNGKTYTSIELAEMAKGKPLAPQPKVPPSVPRSLTQP